MLRQASKMTVRIGYIPEHFSTPIAFAKKYGFYEKHGLADYELIPYPSGSGHLITSLKNKEVDIVVGLTEAFVRGICNGDEEYRIVGEYVDSPLCWSISTGAQRSELHSVDDLKKEGHNRIGVSRIGSGSYVMSFVLGLQEQFPAPFDFRVLDNFKNLRDSVNKAETDAFMWEYFTTKKYYDSGEIKKIGHIYTPWSSWVVAASTNTPHPQVASFLQATQEGIDYYNRNQTEALDYILANLDYNNRQDLQEWAAGVKFASDVSHIQWEKNIVATAQVLNTAGVLQETDSSIISERLLQGVTK